MMNYVNVQLKGGSLDGTKTVIEAPVPPPVLRLRSFAGRETIYKMIRRIDATTGQYEFFDYWGGKVEIVKENP